MASLDPAALERELAQLRKQRYEVGGRRFLGSAVVCHAVTGMFVNEIGFTCATNCSMHCWLCNAFADHPLSPPVQASQRVRASRQAPMGPGMQSRGMDPAGSRPGERRFGAGPPSARGEGPRGAPFRDGPLAGRLGPGPASRGAPDAGPARGGRFDGPARDGDRFGDRFGGPSARGAREPFGRDRDRDADRERDRDGRDAKAAAPARRRLVLSSVVVGNGAGAAPREGEEDRDREGEERVREDAEEGRGGDRVHVRHTRDHEEVGTTAAANEDDSVDRKAAAAAGGRWGPAMSAAAGAGDEAGGRGTKRPAPGAPGVAAEDPDSRKRARRLLGRALLGTLQKFRQEDAQFQVRE